MNSEQCVIKTNRDMRELQAHGTAEFPCAIYTTDRFSPTAEIVPWHWHEEFEIIHIKEGQCTVRVPGKEEILLEGTVALINANTLHSIEGTPGYVLQSFVFSPLLITGDKASAFYSRYIGPVISTPFLFFVINSEDAESLFEDGWKAEKDGKDGWEFTVRENLSKLILLVCIALRNSLREKPPGKTADTLRTGKMLEYMEIHYAEPISLEDISSQISLSVRETLRCFKRTTGDTPIGYLLKFRLMKSADLLRKEPALTVSEVALYSGFDSPSYYAKEFKRFYHSSPSEYRKIHQK